jgi:hypothetical protein
MSRNIAAVDPEQYFATRRRQILHSAGIASAGSVAGCSGPSGGGQNDGEPSAPRQQADEASAHDHAGDHLGESAPVERLDVARLSGSRREGDTVYYHPEDRGPYADGQAALADVPPGGTFVLGHGRYDVATEGRLVRERPINLRGLGWHRDPASYGTDTQYRGSVVVNTGDDVIDEPAIDCDAPDPGTEENADVSPAKQNTIRDLAVLHDGPNSAALRMRNFIFNTVADCGISCRNTGAKGVHFDESAFFTRMERCQVTAATDICVHVDGGGYAHEFYSNHVRTHNPDARAVLQTERQRTIIVGGEYGMRNEDGPPAIRFFSPAGNGVQSGGLVLEPGLEHDSRIEIDGRAPFDDVQLYHVKLPAHHNDEPTVTFGLTNNSKLIHPVIQRKGHFVKWTERSDNCGVITDGATLRQCTYTDEGAENPWIRVTGGATDEQLREIPTGVPTTVDYNVESAAPLIHDDAGWRRVQTTDHSLTEE